MIIETEFRLGNLIYYGGELGIIAELKTYGNNKIGVRTFDFDNYVSFGKEIKPIKLTPELLEKCGFEKRFIKDNICYCLPYLRPSGKKPLHDIVLVDFGTVDNNLKNIYAFAIKEYDRDIQFAVTYIKHLHQLQNLYFTLTGKELIINFQS